ncbi:CCA tRNA nucleotidyltransferase [Fictibacillus sp. 5RED26]|uniref:CCA tRNA nucleotidyltransferase n=1 Tax=unclassified Fictibacillus TaxID=2644029 RepID=UPI0018CD4068|nr:MULTISPECIES: CCA tRNA nucleotidyltransferase [unclassified Fictibacillus]MBH0157435.1 CCA tRNA nucleotidyltransferase [Fictibacillus sp. 5RED26]MBH0174365.1 CCA tRNA nucleotidyltransferase [Fictibacillus sp. 23RED33]
MNEMFQNALPVLKRLEEKGYRAYFVGGCVRDHLLDRPIKDIDIASSARPEDVQRIFPKTIPVGIEHGTVIVRHESVSYEVTTFRKEDEYRDYRRPSKVWFVDDLKEDLSRRDFTFNAMALDTSFQLIDHFGGREDLKREQIRTVGDPNLRFSEDPLRIMRACRFMSVYNMTIEAETKRAIKDQAYLLRRISTERIAIEFIKLLQGVQAGIALKFMKESSVLDHMPTKMQEKQNAQFMDFDWNELESDEQRWTAILLLSDVSDVRGFLKVWKLPNHMIKKVGELMSAYRITSWSKMDLYRFGLETALSSITLKSAIEKKDYAEEIAQLKQRYSEIPITSRKDIPLDGKEISEITQREPGIWLGKLLEEMEKKIVEGELALSSSVLKDWVKRWEP